MYMSDRINEIRKILRKPFDPTLKKFELLRDIAELVSIGHPLAQDFVLRMFARRQEFIEFHDIVIELIKQVGLYPYLKDEDLSLRDLLAVEMHRVDGMDEIVFHSSQMVVYNHLMDGKNVILSAPTSYGKSLIIDSMIASGRYDNIVIIVPSIALIDETRKRLSVFKEGYKVITYPYQELASRNIMVLTQERAIEIIEQVKVDFFVIDEFYKIGARSDGDERYKILNQVFYKLVKTGAQFYLLGPNIENIKTGALENIQFEFIKTDFKTVVSERHQITIHADEDRLEKLIDILHKTDQPTLVYCKSPVSANKLAAQLIEHNIYGVFKQNDGLVAWIRENYHPEWILARAIEHGIGIHHGKNPRALSQQCVKLFNEGLLKCLICTSTLIEGVNTKAKNVVIYDDKISTNKIDFFTFNNICGRSGRMFSHYIGHVYLFKEPPQPELPMVEFPIFTQAEDAPDEMLINIEEEDLTDESKEKLKVYKEQEILTLKTLRDNSYISLKRQLDLAHYIEAHIDQIHTTMCWKRLPSFNQLREVCTLIWDFFEGGNKMVCGVKSGKQLAFRINSYQKAGCIRQFIRMNHQEGKDINDTIELSLDIQRHWINFKFPRYLRSLNQIANDVFERHGYVLCDCSYYASLVESYFYPSYVVPFDEYGLPVQVTDKLRKKIRFSDTLDEAMKQLKEVNVSAVDLEEIERYFVKNVQMYI